MHASTNLNGLQAEHDDWQLTLNSYREEIKNFNKKLEDIVQSRPPIETLASVEHFQNQFIRQNEVLDILRHDFKQHENLIESLSSKQQENTSHLLNNHTAQREKLDRFEAIFQQLRNEFTLFLSETGVPA